jgi:hypothetical protein
LYPAHVWPPFALPHLPFVLTGGVGVDAGSFSSSQGVEEGLMTVPKVVGVGVGVASGVEDGVDTAGVLELSSMMEEKMNEGMDMDEAWSAG